ncbi:hypothetical protein ACJDU8_25660 [Clostridium sp. WILCCON 0269]|uniref:Uncharacterized protein n=1 Tax=Candidatus Clostridium eludens TaxID=3381663 RepID=A0ABW8SVW0_9CLOT
MKGNDNNSPNIALIGNDLDKVKGILQDLLVFSLEEIKNNPSSEERILTLWCNHIKSFNDFFFKEFERTNNKKLYKRAVRLLIFKH